jgi:hypothetical protein
MRPPALLASFVLLLALCAACSKEGGAVLVLDRFCPLSMKPEEELENLRNEARRLCGKEISLLKSGEEDIPVLLEEYLHAKKPEAVFLDAFSAMDLRPLAEKFSGVRFFVLNAPESGILRDSPFIWVFFDRKPAMRELGVKIHDFLGNRPGAASAAAFLEPTLQDMWDSEPATKTLRFPRIEISGEDTVETVRGRVESVLASKPSLYIIAAGPHSALIIDLVRQQGSPASLILEDAEDLPPLEGFPVLASFRWNYARAIGAACLSAQDTGGFLRVPVELH